MTDKILYWTTLIFASLSLLMFIANTAMIRSNQTMQAELGQRQNVINVASQVAPLNQQLSQALYDFSVKKDDGKIRDLLTSQGFTLPEKGATAQKSADTAKASAKAPAKKDMKKEEE